ncbi:hypothetical protein D3875_02620 [Deinococcus cavernae]|uniref:Holin n=1 Tax=Deinococcus cavernae TaxID=2320857 RepID=A0A418VFQ3_9DEIO|nr:hypothetical protein [Deinococcus cavernae]RJF74907.1 hypothetical protein D3875_02620 [Deinococcus cavernae]
MTKTFIILAAVTMTAHEARGGFPLSHSDLWSLLFVAVAALLTSFSNEASKQREGEKFVLLHFVGDVGMGLMAGIAVPLIITWIFEHYSQSRADWRASVGLSILGAYIGRDALKALWNGLLAIGEVAAKLKGMKVSFDPKTKGGTDAESGTATPTGDTETADQTGGEGRA